MLYRLAVMTAIVLVATACGSDSSQIDALEERVQELEAEHTSSTTSAPESKTVVLSGGISKGGRADQSLSGAVYVFESDLTTCRILKPSITLGAEVIVTDGSGTILGVSNILLGEFVNDPDSDRGLCTMPFFVDVPNDADFYTVEINGIAGPTFTNADLVLNGWDISLEG